MPMYAKKGRTSTKELQEKVAAVAAQEIGNGTNIVNAKIAVLLP